MWPGTFRIGEKNTMGSRLNPFKPRGIKKELHVAACLHFYYLYIYWYLPLLTIQFSTIHLQSKSQGYYIIYGVRIA